MMAVAKESGIRIAVVDDDMWVRTGRVSTLESAGLTVVMACDHDQALAGDDQWTDVDVVLVDAWDASQEWDRFPGVRVVESVRRVRSSNETLVIVISGHVTNELLRLRMAEAGADFFYGHGELRNLDDLLQAIRSPNQARRARPHSEHQGCRSLASHRPLSSMPRSTTSRTEGSRRPSGRGPPRSRFPSDVEP